MMLNLEVLNNANFSSQEEFGNFFTNYFLEFENVYKKKDYLNRKKYIEKFTQMYNLCNIISNFINELKKIYDDIGIMEEEKYDDLLEIIFSS